jgi:hypothetical protein
MRSCMPGIPQAGGRERPGDRMWLIVRSPQMDRYGLPPSPHPTGRCLGELRCDGADHEVRDNGTAPNRSRSGSHCGTGSTDAARRSAGAGRRRFAAHANDRHFETLSWAWARLPQQDQMTWQISAAGPQQHWRVIRSTSPPALPAFVPSESGTPGPRPYWRSPSSAETCRHAGIFLPRLSEAEAKVCAHRPAVAGMPPVGPARRRSDRPSPARWAGIVKRVGPHMLRDAFITASPCIPSRAAIVLAT